jgi:glutamine amidotransferase
VGWNNLIIKRESALLDYTQEELNVYFVHSYYVEVHQQNIIIATCEYGREFCAMIEKDNIFATQFHPEKSQRVGLMMLKKFAE